MVVALKRVIPPPPLSYPMLQESKNGLIVLFLKKNVGIVITDPTGYSKVGEFCDNWMMGNFEPYHGEVTISN